jgi:hypothetical protein
MQKQIFTCLLVLVFSASAFAQREDSPEHRQWEVTGFVGNSFPHDFQLPEVRMHFGSGYQIGVRLNDNVRDHVSVNLEYSLAHQDLGFTTLAPPVQNVSVTQYVHYFSYNVAYVVLPPTRRFRPYGEVGVGSALYFLPKTSIDTMLQRGVKLRDSWVFLVNCGGGFKYLVKDQFAVTFDLKDRLFNIPSYGLSLSTHGIGQTWQATIGLAYQWDEY